MKTTIESSVYRAVITCEDSIIYYIKDCYKTAVCKQGQLRRMFVLVKVHRSRRRSAPRTQELSCKWKCYSLPSVCRLSSEGGRLRNYTLVMWTNHNGNENISKVISAMPVPVAARPKS